MPVQRIGNWEVTEEGITWVGRPKKDYTIPTNRLTEAGEGARAKMYDWLVHMTEKGWLTEKDIYALNTALIYALELAGKKFPAKLSFIETFTEQQARLLRRKDQPNQSFGQAPGRVLGDPGRN